MELCNDCGGSLPSTTGPRSLASSEYSRHPRLASGSGRVTELEVEGFARGEGLRYCCQSTQTTVFLATRVHSKKSTAEKIVVGLDNVESIVHTQLGRLATRPTVTENGDGSFELQYTLPHVGSFALTIKLFQQHIKGSPFAVECVGTEEYSAELCSLHSAASPAPVSKSSSGSSRHSIPLSLATAHGPIEDELVLRFGGKGRGRGRFLNPQDVTALPDGRLIVSDSSAQVVQVFSAQGNFRSSFGAPGLGGTPVRRPVGLCTIGRSRVAVTDYDAKCAVVFDLSSSKVRCLGKLGTGRLLGPKGILVDREGRLIVIDNKGASVFIFSATGAFLGNWGRRGTGPEALAGPHYAALDSHDHLYISDFHHHSVKVFDLEGRFIRSFGASGAGNGQFNGPTGLAIDADDRLLVADWGNNRIQVLDALSGSFLAHVSSEASPLFGPQGLCLLPDGTAAVADSGSHAVKVFRYLS